MFHPVPLSHLAGRGFTPERRTPMDGDHERLDAVWMPAGNWRRPSTPPRGPRTRGMHCRRSQGSARECRLIDVGTLGKIEAHGPQAGAFLDRVYTGKFDSLKVGMDAATPHARRERVDHRRRRNRAARAGSLLFHDDHRQLRHHIPRTRRLANLVVDAGRSRQSHGPPRPAFNLAGPRSREVLSKLTALDVSEAAFPYLGVREAKVCRLSRRASCAWASSRPDPAGT